MHAKLDLSLLPVDVSLFEELLFPCLAGRLVDSEPFIAAALEHSSRSHRSRRCQRALEEALEATEPTLPPERTLKNALKLVKAFYDDFTREPDPFRDLLVRSVDPDVHLQGRPFFIGEESAPRVADAVDAFRSARGSAAIDRIALDQLAKLSPRLEGQLSFEDGSLPPDLSYRSDLSLELKNIRALVVSAERNETVYSEDGKPILARQRLAEELPWRAVALLGRAMPCWRARDGASLATLCMEAGIPSPEAIETPRRLFLPLVTDRPEMASAFGFEVSAPFRLGAFVPPEAVTPLLSFLKQNGARLIQAATRAGRSRRCSLFIGKMREAAEFAARHGFGLLEASELPEADRPETSATSPTGLAIEPRASLTLPVTS